MSPESRMRLMWNGIHLRSKRPRIALENIQCEPMGSGVRAWIAAESGDGDGVRARRPGLDLASSISDGLDTTNE